MTMLPRYLQIKNYLIGKIESGEFQKDEKLPSERELSERFKISRMTARNAIVELVRDGYVYRNGAKGTFVAGKKVKRNFLHACGFRTYMEESGMKDVKTTIICFEKVEADAWLSKQLQVNIGQACYHLLRLRSANGQNMAVDESYLNGKLMPNLMQYDFSQVSLWEVMGDRYHCKPVRTSSAIELHHFEKRESKLLDVKNGTVGFRVLSTNYAENQEIVEYCVTYYRGDLFLFAYETDVDGNA